MSQHFFLLEKKIYDVRLLFLQHLSRLISKMLFSFLDPYLLLLCNGRLAHRDIDFEEVELKEREREREREKEGITS